MAKIDNIRRTDIKPFAVAGELQTVASVLQISYLTVTGPYSGDFQITDNGRLIVGDNPDIANRVIVGNYGMQGWDANGILTFSVWTRTMTEPNGRLHTAGDAHLGNVDSNHMSYKVVPNELGIYTESGAGFVARGDGSLFAGDSEGAHLEWDAGTGALEIYNGAELKVHIGADGDASFDGTIYASGGRIYGTMVVDDVLRAGNVDGPAIYLGRFQRETTAGVLVLTSEILATDDQNLPWLHVVAGGETLPGYFHLGGTGEYAQHLSFDGTTLETDGTLISAGGRFRADPNGVAFTENPTTYWRIQPTAAYFMELTSSQGETYNTLRVNEANGIAGYFSGGYIGLYARSTSQQLGIFGYSGDPATVGAVPDIDALDSDRTDGIAALEAGTSIYALTEGGTAGRFIAVGGRGIVGSTDDAAQAGITARNTGGGAALTVESSHIELSGNSILNSGAIRMDEISTPGAQADHGILYCVDKSGKTALMVRFGTGAEIELAVEP